MPSTLMLAVIGVLAVVLVALAALEMRDEGKASGAVETGSEKAAGGLRGLLSVTRALGFGAFLIIQTAIAEFADIGFSILEIIGPLTASNLAAIGVGTLGIAGVIPTSPYWYAGIMLMIFGIALSSAGEAIFERYSG